MVRKCWSVRPWYWPRRASSTEPNPGSTCHVSAIGPVYLRAVSHFGAHVICANPRSGSTFPCKRLAAAGCAAKPASYFRSPPLVDWMTHSSGPTHLSEPVRRPAHGL
ncbi:Stf0 family sulfotransferase [Ruegeria sp. MALMAid1280]|uniref:Stf0 family sulfotransferase n=1 Tax=Ruegeria sp. MALMAid1280 TaxID=3411634 RepID=UPI003BA3C161